MIRRFVFLAALVLAFPVRSQTPPLTAIAPTVVQSGSAYVVTYPTATPSVFQELMSRTYTPSQLSSGAVEVRDALTARGPAGNLPLVSARTVTAASVASGLARVASRVSVPLAVGSLAYDLLASNGVRQGASGAEIDPGADPSPQNVWTVVCPGNGNKQASGAEGAITACHTARSSTSFIPLRCDSSTGYLYPDGNKFTERCYFRTAPAPNGYEDFYVYTATKSTQLACSPIVDSLTGQSYVPGTLSNGKCITGRYSPATDIEVEARVLPSVSANTTSLTNAIKAVLAALGSLTASPPLVTGPASQTGTPATTTTTGPAGTTSTTTTPTYQYNYAGDTVTYTTNNQTTTNITSPDGTVTTETKTEDIPPDTKQLCDTYPDSLACMKPGTPPDAEQIPIDRRQVTITPDTSRWSPTAGACTRGAIQLTSGASINLWQPFCDFFSLIRGVVVGVFGLAGAFIFRNGIK